MGDSQGVKLTYHRIVVLALPLILAQTPPGGAECILPFRQHGGVQRRRFRRQPVPFSLRFCLMVLQRPPFLGQLKLRLLGAFAGLGNTFFPAIHLVPDHQRRVEGLEFILAPLVAQV